MNREPQRYAKGARRLIVVVIACLLAPAVFASNAAAGLVTEESETVTVAAGEHLEYSVGCSGNERVTGVGFAASKPDTESGIGITSALAPTGKTNVVVRGSEVGKPAQAVEHSAYAYCVRKLRQRIKIGTEPTVTSGIAVAVAECPGKKRAIGGGFFAPPFGGSNGELAGIVISSHRGSKSTWRVAYFNADSDDNSEFTAYAICAKVKVKQAVASGTAKTDGGGSAKAKCPKRRVAVSGGFAAVADVGPSDGSVALPFSSKRIGKRSWRTTATPNSSTPEDFRSYVYCMKKDK